MTDGERSTARFYLLSVCAFLRSEVTSAWTRGGYLTPRNRCSLSLHLSKLALLKNTGSIMNRAREAKRQILQQCHFSCVCFFFVFFFTSPARVGKLCLEGPDGLKRLLTCFFEAFLQRCGTIFPRFAIFACKHNSALPTKYV